MDTFRQRLTDRVDAWLGRPPPQRILLLCTANVCRSPMAAALLRHHLALLAVAGRVRVASAATDDGMAGAPTDPRVLRVLAARGVAARSQPARLLRQLPPGSADRVYCMEPGHRQALLAQWPVFPPAQVSLLLDFLPGRAGRSVPDPYFGNEAGFEEVYALLDEATAALAARLADGG